jgi:hypothetical protein
MKVTSQEHKHMYLACFSLVLVSVLALLLLSSGEASITGMITANTTLSTLAGTEQENQNPSPNVPEQATLEQALDALQQAERNLEEMKEFGMGTTLIEDTLLLAERTLVGTHPETLYKAITQDRSNQEILYLEEILQVHKETPVYELQKQDFAKVILLAQEISNIKKKALHVQDQYVLLQEKEKVFQEKKIDTSEGVSFMNQSMRAFKEERYDEAQSKLEEADLALNRARTELGRVKSVAKFSKNFVVRNWWQIVIVLAVLAGISPRAWKTYQHYRNARKVQDLRTELESLNELMKKIQTDYFNTKKIAKATYDIRLEKYRKRIHEIKHTLPVLEARLKGKKKGKIKEKFGLQVRK